MSLIWALFCAFDLGSSLSFSSFSDVIDHILSICNALGVCLVTQDLLTKTVTKTVTEQWWNSDAFNLSTFILLSRFWDVIDHILSLNNALEVWLLIWWWNITFWQKQWCNSDETVMEQWCNSDRTVMHLIWAL
jgi:hypothetical protein